MKKNQGELDIKRGKLKEIIIYEVTDEELKAIETNNTHSGFEKLYIPLIFLSFQMIFSLLTNKVIIENQTTRLISLVIISVIFMFSFQKLMDFFRQKKQIKILVDRIRQRIE